jgi:hypothetical protein
LAWGALRRRPALSELLGATIPIEIDKDQILMIVHIRSSTVANSLEIPLSC